MDNYCICIGRQLGSGGSSLGKALAKKFGFQYIDKEILMKAAKQLDMSEDAVKEMDEKSVSIWNILAQTAAYEVPYVADEWYVPTSTNLFKVQSQIMRESLEKGPCVIVGRCASYLFRDSDKSRSIFFYADKDSRLERLKKTLGDEKTEAEMVKLMNKEDKDRAKYYNFYTGNKWLELTNYDMSLNTTDLTDDEILKVVSDYLITSFPELG